MDTEKRGDDAFSVIKLDTSFGADAGGDFTLPDYMPEIKRVLYVSGAVLPEGKFLDGGAMELEGSVAYNVIYVGDDGKFAAAPFTAEYSADISLPHQPAGTESVFVDTEIESTSYRATGPRSINIKSRLRFRVAADEVRENDDTATDRDGRAASDASCGIERLTCDLSSAVRRRGSVTENASCEMTAPSGAKPVMCDGMMAVTSAAAEASSVKASGKICITCSFDVGDGEIKPSECEIPFEASVPVSSDLPLSGARAWGRVASVSVTPSETDGKYNVAVEYDLEAEAYSETATQICTDVYSTDHELECAFCESEIPSVMSLGTKRLDVSGETDLKDGVGSAEVMNVSLSSCQVSVSVSDGRFTASGAVKVRVLLGSDTGYYPEEVELPVRTELEGSPEGVSAQDIQSSVFCSCADAAARVSSGRLSVDCDLVLSYAIYKKQKVRFLESVKLGDEAPSGDSPCIRVYYPDQDESAWSICKKYRADRTRFMKNNSFDKDIARKGEPVIIL